MNRNSRFDFPKSWLILSLISKIKCITKAHACNRFEFLSAMNMNQKWSMDLDELGSLPDNYDGENSSAMLPGVVDNCKFVLDRTRDYIAYLEEIYPMPYGTICMEWKMPDGYVNAQISPDYMTFYHDRGVGNPYSTLEKSPFDNERVALLLRELSLYLPSCDSCSPVIGISRRQRF